MNEGQVLGSRFERPNVWNVGGQRQRLLTKRSSSSPIRKPQAAGDGSVSATNAISYDSVGNAVAVDGPIAGSADTTAYFYDADRERTGQISADPDGAGPLSNRAVRLSHNGSGQVTLTEVGSSSGTDATALSNMSVSRALTVSYEASGRKTRETLSAAGTTFAVTDYSYDAVGRPLCTAVRMNANAWGTATDACTLQVTGTIGPDRIDKVYYDVAGQVTQKRSGVNTTDETVDAGATYSPNGMVATAIDANNDVTTYGYDGFDRLVKTTYPDGSYEAYTPDANGNITNRRLRDGTSISYTYDNLDRLTTKILPNGELPVTYSYDNLGRLKTASETGDVLTFGYDALGRQLTQTGPEGMMTSTYESAGRRIKLQWPDTFFVNYDYDVLGEMTAVRENGAASGVGVLATYTYDNLGDRTHVTNGNGTASTWTPDSASRLSQLSQLFLDLPGTASDLTRTFSYNPANQIISRANSNDGYAWNGGVPGTRTYTTNGLNQYATVSGVTQGYDVRGNLISSSPNSYSYSSENLMTRGPGGTTLGYDPLLRMVQITQGSTTTKFGYDGLAMIGEYSASNVLAKRYVYGPGTDEPIVQYNGSGTSSRNWLLSDERSSVVVLTDASGATVGTNTYDEYGMPGASNSGRFQYTGQAWIPEIGLYYYKGRMYSPSLGRFMQTDPIGYGDGLNWYAYAGGGPINRLDTTGNFGGKNDDIWVYGSRLPKIIAIEIAQYELELQTNFRKLQLLRNPTGNEHGGGDNKPICSRLQIAAAFVGEDFDHVPEQLGTAALMGMAGTAAAGGLEEFSFGFDTPATIHLGPLTGGATFAATATGALGAAFNDFAAGNQDALVRFSSIESSALIAEKAVSHFSSLSKYSELMGSLTEKALGIAPAEKKAGCGGK